MISKLLKGLGDKKDSKGSKEPVSTAAPPVPPQESSSEASAHPQHPTTTSPAEKGTSSHHGDKGSTSPSGVTTTEGGSSPVIGRSSSGNDATSSQEPERFQSRGSGRVERGGNIFPTTSGSSSDNDNQRRSGSSGRFKSPPLGGTSVGRSISPNRDSPLLRTNSPKSDHRGSPQAIDGSPSGLNSSGFRQARVFPTTTGGAVGFSQDRTKRAPSPLPHSSTISSGCPFGGDDDGLGGSTTSGGGGNNSARGPPPIPVSGTAEVSFRSFAENIGALSARFYALHPEERLDDMENSEDVVKLRKLHAPPHPQPGNQQRAGKLPICDHNGNTAISNILSATTTQSSDVLSTKGYSTINSSAWKRPFEDDDNTLTSISPLPRSVSMTPPLVPNANIEALLGADWASTQPPSTSPSNDHSPDGGEDSSEGSLKKSSGGSDRPFGGMQDTINDLTARMEHEMINPEDITGGVAELYHTAFLRQPLTAYCTKKFKKLVMGRLPSGGLSPFRGAHNPHRRTLSTNSATRGFRPSPRNHDQMATSNKVVELPGVAEQLQSTPEAFVFHQHYRHRVACQSGTTSTGRTPHGSGLAPSNGHPSRNSFSSLRGSTRHARDIFTLSMNLSPPCTPRTDEAGCGLRQLTPAEFADIEAVGDVISGVVDRGPETPSDSDSSCDDDGDMVEGLLATGGANPSRLSASFSLAPTSYTTPADSDEQIPGKPASPGESSPTPSPTNSDDAAPPSPCEGSGLANNTGGDSASAVPLLTCLDIVTSNGTMLCVMGDAQGRIELLEGPEGPDWEERGPPSQRIISRKHQLDTHTQQQQMNQVSPTAEFAYPPDFSTDDLSPRSFVTTPCTETNTSAAAPPPVNVPPLRHDEAAALAGGHSSIGVVPMFRTSSPNRGPQRSSVFKAREPSLATQCGNFSRRCQHQAFVNEFDCLKSVVIDQQLRCVKFLPPNRAQGVTSYLAANEKTIKLFRIKSDQYQQSSVWEPPGSAMSGSTLLSNNASGTFSSPPTSSTSTSHKKRRHSLRGSIGSSTNRLHRRIVMPVKAFTNVHQYPIQSISLSADGETFLSMDDFRVYWWHLDASDTTKATLLCDIKPPGNNEIDTLLTAASFHHTHSSLFLCAQSDGVCNVGDLRDPPCRGKSRKYPVSFKINPELHNAVNHPYHDDILSAISAASFLGHNYVVTRDYMTLKLWDLRNSACPAATCPVMGYLGSTIDFLYDSDYIFDRFPLAVDNASMSVVTGMYDGTVAVWRPGRGLYRNSSLPGADNEYHDPTATSPFGFGRNTAGRIPPNPSMNSANYKFISSSGGVVAAYDEVEFYAAQQPLGSNDPLNSKGKDKDILAAVQKQIREARLKKRRGGVGNNSNLNSTTNTNYQGYTHQRTLSRNSSMEGSTVGTTGPCTGSFHGSDTALEGSDDGSHASSTYSGDLDDLEDELEPYGQAGDITDMWDVSDDGLGTAYVPKAHKTHISLSLLKARSVVMSAEEDEELLYRREKNRRIEEARVRRRQEILKSQQAAAMGGSSSSDDEARGESTSGMRRTGNMNGMDALDDESRGGHDTTTATTHEEDTPTVYPRVRSRCRDRRVTNVAISPGGDRFSFSTNEHVFFFNSAL